MTEITDAYEVQAGDVVTVRVISEPGLTQPLEGQEMTFTARGPVEYLGQGFAEFQGMDGYAYPLGAYAPFEFVKAERL